MKNLTCPYCGAVLEKRVGTYHYKASGLPYVWLDGVTIRSCTGCDEGGGVEIPDLAGLHAVLVVYLIHRKTRFASDEIKFLRKSLGYVATDKPIESYSIHDTEGLEPRGEPPQPVRIAHHKDHWSRPVIPGMPASACC